MNAPKLRFRNYNSSWNRLSLGDISNITKLAGFEFTKYVSYSDKGSIIALRGLNVKKGLLDLTDVKYIDNSDFTKLNRSKLFKKDLLFTYVGTIGEAALVDMDDKYYLAPNVCLIRPKEIESAPFLLEYISRKNFKRSVIDPLVTTSSQPSLSMENVRKFTLNLPSLEEQKKISAFIDAFNRKIQLQQEKIDLLKEQKNGFLQKMLPKAGKKQPEMRFGEFAGDWKKFKLGEIAEIKDSARISNAFWVEEGIPYLRSSDLVNDELTGELFISKETYDKYSSKTGAPQNGDVLFTSGGKVGVVYHKQDNSLVYVQGGAVLYVKTSTSKYLEGSFLNMYFSTNEMKRYMENNSVGGTIKHFTLKPANATPIILPSVEEQKAIGIFFKKIDTNINIQQKKLELLQKQKQAFMQQMFI